MREKREEENNDIILTIGNIIYKNKFININYEIFVNKYANHLRKMYDALTIDNCNQNLIHNLVYVYRISLNCSRCAYVIVKRERYEFLRNT